MLKIRMQRTGRINMPSYRIIIVEHTESPKTGNFVEKVGTYNPKTKERTLDTDRVRHWLSVGAQPSPTVHNMLVTIGVLNEKKINVLPRKSPPKQETPAEVAGPAAPAAEVAPTQPIVEGAAAPVEEPASAAE